MLEEQGVEPQRDFHLLQPSCLRQGLTLWCHFSDAKIELQVS